MIVPEPNEQIYGVEMEEIEAQSPTIFSPSAHRVSEVLGPDGNPLMVGFERVALGFDLRPRRTQPTE